ncbi:hypothetical protein mRhiFer1_009301 [Rhinolophus ferrumequinum]|uniref:Uncharacterized protein n=1 Tax=Rhinolophus ferrumequinum TaxID=59479 RepID=A0A7J7RXL3_RHIFE|nr:hypothetical protein mRhiFer1_009301 [Rhinolophus ferrumequinum]
MHHLTTFQSTQTTCAVVVLYDYTDGIWERKLKWFVHDSKGFTKDEEVAKINTAVAEMANNLNLGVGEDDMEELLDVVPEETTKEEVLELEEEHLAEGEAREKETAGEQEEPVKGLAEAFAGLNKLLNKFENKDLHTEIFSLIERNIHVHYLVTSKSVIKKKKKQTNRANHPWTYF